jgi:hypothetical protein
MTGRAGSAFDIVIAMHGRGAKTGELLCSEQAVRAGAASMNAKVRDPLPIALSPLAAFRRCALDALDRIGAPMQSSVRQSQLIRCGSHARLAPAGRFRTLRRFAEALKKPP